MDSVNNKYYEKFQQMEDEYDEYSELLCSVEIMSDNKLYVHYQNKIKNLKEIVLLFKDFKSLEQEKQVADELLKIEQNQDEIKVLKTKIDEIQEKLNYDFENIKKVYFEQGLKINQRSKIELSYKSGELEFVFEIEEIFKNFAKINRYELSEIDRTETSVSIEILGENSFEILKTFGGVLKKINKTSESLALVVVLKEENSEFEFDENDVEVQISKSSGAGGQHINKTESAVKLIHIPTGITSECQDERSQGKNKERAMESLKQKVLNKIKENQENNIKNQRKLLKNAIFSDTPVMVFDFDRNKATYNSTKKSYDINEILQGNLKIIASDLKV